MSLGVAILWALMPWRVADGLGRAQLLHYQYLPLLVLWLDRYLERGRARDLAFASLFLAWQCLTAYWHAYFAVYCAIVTIAISGALSPSQGRTRRVVASLVALACVVGGLALISLPYLEMARQGQLVPKPAPAALEWYFNRAYFHPIVSYVAAASGVAVVVAMIVRIVSNQTTAVSRPLRLGLVFLYVATAGVLLSLPGHSASAPWLDQLLAVPREVATAIVPGFRYLRGGYRFLTLASLGIYGLAAIGIDTGARALRRRSPPIAAAALVVFFGVAGSALTRIAIPVTPALATDTAPPVYDWLRTHGDGGVVLELPISRNLADAYLDATYMFYSTYHWSPLINGYTGHPPRAFYGDVRALVARLPDENAIRDLTSLTGVRWIVIHDSLYEYFGTRGWGRSPLLKQVGDFDGMYLVEVLR